MFVPVHWAQAFLNAAADDAVTGDVSGFADSGTRSAEALALVKLMAPILLSARGRMEGTAAARRLEVLVRRAFAAVPPGDPRSRELALGLTLLLVKKGLLKHIDRIIEAIEQELDTRRGVLRGTLEFARDPGAELVDTLTEALMKKTGAPGIRLSTRLVPELLAGCRLRIAGDTIDASLQARLRQMETELAGA
jgi:hypothetical protein